jgi:hypothetical protein
MKRTSCSLSSWKMRLPPAGARRMPRKPRWVHRRMRTVQHAKRPTPYRARAR